MISAEEAKKLVRKNTHRLIPAKVPVDEACGLTLAEDLIAGYDIPAFVQSSMDGYAFAFSHWNKKKTLIVDGEIPAGPAAEVKLTPDHAMRIFTGSAVPEGADTVVKQEDVIVRENELTIHNQNLEYGSNVRPAGSEIKKGEKAMEKNNRLTPAGVGFLAGIGIHEVPVYPRPSVCVIVTGNELCRPGNNLQHGQVYESNSYTLKAALRRIQINHIQAHQVKDDPEELINVMKETLNEFEIIMLAGGISVGDYDYVLKALNACGVTSVFHKVKQRPGKPLYFGKSERSVVFGLPGNPSSALTCFYEYVVPAIEIMMNQDDSLKTTLAVLTTDFRKKTELTYFLKGKMDGNEVTPLRAQESYRMRSFAVANCLIKMDEGEEEYKKGSTVEVHIFPE